MHDYLFKIKPLGENLVKFLCKHYGKYFISPNIFPLSKSTEVVQDVVMAD